jgi:PAS domain S-box-containing protein/diguanylate cyclase (GGDEF)-like protein
MPDFPELSLQVTPPNETVPRNIPDVALGVALAAADRTIIQANPAFCNALGYRPDELVGMTVDDITHPEDVGRTKQTFERLINGRGTAHTYEKRYQRKDGTILWSHTTVNRIEGGGGSDRSMFIGFIDDISQQKETEEKLRATKELYQSLVDNLGVGLSLIDHNHNIQMVNPALAGMFDKSPEDFIGKSCHREFEGIEAVCLHCPGVKAMRSGQPEIVETEGVRPDNSQFRVRIKAFPFLDQKGKPAGFVELIEDLTAQYKTKLALGESEHRFQVLAETTSIGIFEVDREGRNTYSNPAWTRMTGLSLQESLGTGWTRAIPAEDREELRESWEEAKKQGISWRREHRLLHTDGDERWVQATATPVRDAEGKLLRWVGTIVDLTLHKKAMQQLAESEERFRSLFEKSGVGMNIISRSGRVITANPAFCDFIGYTQQELQSMSVRDITLPEDLERTDQMFERLNRQEGHFNYQKRFRRKDGKTVWGDVAGVLVPGGVNQEGFGIGIIQDITARKEAQARLEYLDYTDELTGLPNRKLLVDRLNHSIAKAQRRRDKVAVLLVGLDRFGKIADNFDLETAQLVLCEITQRLQAIVRDSDTLARIGDTQMVIVLENIKDPKPSGVIAQKVLQDVARPIRVRGRTFNVTVSIGISLFPDDGQDADRLLGTASLAMHISKRQGGDMFEYNVPELNARTHELLALETDLRAALEKREFVLFYQPQIELATKRVVGFEALLRWRHPQRGLVPPNDFIPLAEDTGVIVPLGEWVLQEACRQNMEWSRAGLPMVRMAVNISPRQFKRVDIPTLVRQVLEETGHPPEYLELEVTESMIMEDVDRAIGIMHTLTELGVHLAIDDFGTGYSSLSYLKRFPVRRLKVDRSFVKDVLVDPNDAAIASAVVSLAKSMDLEVVAEGIETEDQLAFFLERGCDSCQGFLFSKPLEPALAREYLGANR